MAKADSNGNVTAPKEGEESTLAEVQNPAKLTNKDIESIAGSDGNGESSADDAAKAMKQDRDEAKGKAPPPGPLAGMGGAIEP